LTPLRLRPLPMSARVRYREEVARRIEHGTYRMAMQATPAQIRNSIQDLLAIINDPKTEPDVREWKRADLRALRRALKEKERTI
jgi:hypothetical protein